MKKHILLAAAAILGCAGAANAQSVNFDEFTSPPVTCCYGNPVTGPLVYPAVTIHDGANSGQVMDGSGWQNDQTSGQNLFGTTSGTINFDFSSPVSGLAFDLINGTDASRFTVSVFGTGDVLLDSQIVSLGSWFTQSGNVGHVSFADSGITNAVITGNNDFAVDTINFNVSGVPEPSTWAMMLLGFGAIGFATRRRRTLALA